MGTSTLSHLIVNPGNAPHEKQPPKHAYFRSLFFIFIFEIIVIFMYLLLLWFKSTKRKRKIPRPLCVCVCVCVWLLTLPQKLPIRNKTN